MRRNRGGREILLIRWSGTFVWWPRKRPGYEDWTLHWLWFVFVHHPYHKELAPFNQDPVFIDLEEMYREHPELRLF